MLTFEWDPTKERINWRKHGVTFSEAATVFDDILAKVFVDESHSENELREIIVGHSVTGSLLFVNFIERTPDLVPIFSAREATKMERQEYEEAL